MLVNFLHVFLDVFLGLYIFSFPGFGRAGATGLVKNIYKMSPGIGVRLIRLTPG